LFYTVLNIRATKEAAMKKVSFLFTMILSVLFLTGFEAVAEKGSDSGIICNNEYVLCTSAPCVPDPSNPDSKAICSCEVNKGLTGCHNVKPGLP
jgi:hypothetical protein